MFDIPIDQALELIKFEPGHGALNTILLLINLWQCRGHSKKIKEHDERIKAIEPQRQEFKPATVKG